MRQPQSVFLYLIPPKRNEKFVLLDRRSKNTYTLSFKNFISKRCLLDILIF